MMAEEKKVEEEKSSRTKLLESMPPNAMQKMMSGISPYLDKLGITQEKEYKGKTKEEMAVKKAKGGSVSSASKRADGCAMRGKTRGKMV